MEQYLQSHLDRTHPHWYVLRTTYGREKRAYDYMVAHGVKAYYPTIRTTKTIKGQSVAIEESRLPNLFFAYGTEAEISRFVFDNVHLPFLRFYYRHIHGEGAGRRVPMIVPDRQMRSLMIICAAEEADILVAGEKIRKFEKGQLVRVVDGMFAGVVGRVARFMGQQRVAIYLGGVLTMTTAYVPNDFLEPFEDPVAAPAAGLQQQPIKHKNDLEE